MERISEKQRARYDCAGPLELLANIDNGVLAHASDEQDIWGVTDGLAGSQFRRVWVFEGQLNRVALTLP